MKMHRTSAFGELLRRHRLAAGLTQEALAERATLSARAVSDLERGVKSRPHPHTVHLLAVALGLEGAALAALLAARGQTNHADGGLPRGRGQVPGGSGLATPLVGRDEELALLERHLVGEGPPVLLLAGEPGIGKSRLLGEADARAWTRGWRVLAGGCQRRRGHAPFAPLQEALESYIVQRTPGELRTELRGCAWLVRLLPELAEGPIESLPAWTLPPEQERRLMDRAVGRFLANVTGPAGTLLLLDDLQWAGADALTLLVTLVCAATEPPLRVVGAYRDSEVAANDPLAGVLADLAHAGLVSRHALDPLPPEEASVLLDALLEGRSWDAGAAGVREQAVRRAGGVPFYLVSYAQALRADLPEAAATVPWDVAQGVRQRLAALSEAAREMLGAAAVIGRVVPHALLAAVMARPEGELLAALEVTCQARLLNEAGGEDYQFAHDVIREVVEAGLSAGRRRALHRRVADALERAAGEQALEVLAYHHDRGGSAEKAMRYLEQAGDRARAQHANAAAEGYYREAVARLDDCGRSLEAARVRERRGAALLALGRYEAALAVLDEAAQAYGAAGDVESLGRAVAQIGRVHNMQGTPAAGIDRLQSVLPLLESRPASPALAALYATLAALLVYSGHFREDLAWAERAAEVARALRDERGLAFAQYHIGMALTQLGEVERGLQVLEEAVSRAEAVGDLATLCEALDPAGYCYAYRGDIALCTACFARAVAVAEQLSDPAWIANMVTHRGIPALFAGQWGQARDDIQRGVTLSRQVGSDMVLGYTLVWRGRLALWTGDWAAARQDLEELARLERGGDLGLLREAESLLAELDLLQGRPEAARTRLVPLLDRPGLEELTVTQLLPTLAWAQLELGDAAAAGAIARQAAQRAWAATWRLTLVDALRVQAMVASRQAWWAEAEQALEEGLALARGTPYPYAEARLLHVYGALHARKGEPDLARERLEAARTIFRRLGARKDVERVEEMLAVLG